MDLQKRKKDNRILNCRRVEGWAECDSRKEKAGFIKSNVIGNLSMACGLMETYVTFMRMIVAH